MAIYTIVAQSNASNVTVNLNSTKVKVVSNVAVYYATGANPVAYNSGNCALLPANTIRDINCGPGVQTTANAAVISGVGPKIAFLASTGTAGVTVTEIGYVNFFNVSN